MLHALALIAALHQPVLVVQGSRVAVDTGGDTLITKQSTALAPHKQIAALGRTDRALLAPQSYLSHWYLSDSIVASLGPTWIDRGPVTFDFVRDTVTLEAIPSPLDRVPIAVAQGYPFLDVRLAGGAAYTCLLDTGAVGRSGATLRAVNTLDAGAFDALLHAHPAWSAAGTVTIATDRGTVPAPQIRVPGVRVGRTEFANVVFVRREPRTFQDLTKILGRKVSCDAGGALFAGHVVTLDVPNHALSL